LAANIELVVEEVEDFQVQMKVHLTKPHIWEVANVIGHVYDNGFVEQISEIEKMRWKVFAVARISQRLLWWMRMNAWKHLSCINWQVREAVKAFWISSLSKVAHA